MNKFEYILSTTKDEAETWLQVYERLNKQGTIDIKTLSLLVFTLLEEYERNQRKN